MIRSMSWRNRKAAQAFLEEHSDMTSPMLGNLISSSWNRDPFSKRKGYCFLNIREGELVGFLGCFMDGNAMLYALDEEAILDFLDILDRQSFHTLWVFDGEERSVKLLMAQLEDRFRLVRYHMMIQEETQEVFCVDLSVEDVRTQSKDPSLVSFVRRILKECFGYDAYMPAVMARMQDRSEEEPYLVGSLADGTRVAQTHVQAICSDYGYIGGVATLPEYQGRGYAKQMVLTICRMLHRSGRKVSLTVDPENESAYHLYRKLGFEKRGLVCVLQRKSAY